MNSFRNTTAHFADPMISHSDKESICVELSVQVSLIKSVNGILMFPIDFDDTRFVRAFSGEFGVIPMLEAERLRTNMIAKSSKENFDRHFMLSSDLVQVGFCTFVEVFISHLDDHSRKEFLIPFGFFTIIPIISLYLFLAPTAPYFLWCGPFILVTILMALNRPLWALVRNIMSNGLVVWANPFTDEMEIP